MTDWAAEPPRSRRFKNVVIDLENHNVGGLIGAAFGNGVDNAEGLAKRHRQDS